MQGEKKKEVKVTKLSTVYKYEIQEDFGCREVSVTKTGHWEDITVEDSQKQISIANYSVAMAKEMVKLYELHSDKVKAKRKRKEEKENEEAEKGSKKKKSGQD